MPLSVSVNGGDPVPAEGVVLYNNGVPIAAAHQHGGVILYADAARDARDLEVILKSFGVRPGIIRNSGLVITGNL